MIDKKYGKYYLCCDQCGEEYEEVFDTFDEVIEVTRFRGWRAFKLENIWQHQCPACSGNMNKLSVTKNGRKLVIK